MRKEPLCAEVLLKISRAYDAMRYARKPSGLFLFI